MVQAPCTRKSGPRGAHPALTGPSRQALRMTEVSPERITLGYAVRSEEDLRPTWLDNCNDAPRGSNLKVVWMRKVLPSNDVMLNNRTQRLTKLHSIGIRGGGMKQFVKIDGETRVPPGVQKQTFRPDFIVAFNRTRIL